MTANGKPVVHALLVLNVPTPYRVPALRLLALDPRIRLDVVYCAAPHVDPTLGSAAHGFAPLTLTARYRIHDRRFMHTDWGVVRALQRLKPDVVITTGYIPTFLFAFGWSWLSGALHVAMTDGTLACEQVLGWKHRAVRRFVLRRSRAAIGACDGSLALLRSYGFEDARIFKAPLAIDHQRFSMAVATDERADFIFCGRLVAHKRPAFALQVAAAVARRLGRRATIDFVGAGAEEAALRDQAAALAPHVGTRFHGYATQADLPQRYANARVFLFPSEWDPWGVVANEACACGLPVIVSPHAGSAGELVRDGDNGFVRPLQIEAWVDAAVMLLSDPALAKRMGASGRQRVERFSFEAAAAGIAEAILTAVRPSPLLVAGGRRA